MHEVSKRFEDLTQEQQEFIVDYARNNFSAIQAINERHSAYGLKQRFTARHFYVTQEQFTQAMQRAGFRVKPIGDGNACFNIGERSPHLKRR